jgi:hypothetical protein
MHEQFIQDLVLRIGKAAALAQADYENRRRLLHEEALLASVKAALAG